MLCSTGIPTEYPAYTSTLNRMNTGILPGRTVANAESAHTAVSTTIEIRTSVFRMIHRQRVMLNTKEISPTPPLMMPL